MGQSESAMQASVDLNSPEADFIRETVADNCVVMFSKSYCPYCDDARKIFKKMGTKCLSIELDDRKDGDTLQNILAKTTDARTVPRVFVNGKCIGGFSQTKRLYHSGMLQKLVEQCNSCDAK